MDAHRFDVAESVAFTVCGEEGHVIFDGIFVYFFVFLFTLGWEVEVWMNGIILLPNVDLSLCCA